MRKYLLLFVMILWSGTAFAFPPTMPQASSGAAPAVVDSTDTSTWVLLTDDQTSAAVVPKTDAGLSYNASTGVLTATGFSGPISGAVTGNASTATALAADPGNCAAGQIALGITAAGVAECTATPSGLTSVGATTFTGALTGNASTATALAADPAGCTGGQVTNDINTAGTSTCTAWSANVLSLLGSADYAAMRTLLDLEAGTDFNAYSAALASIASLTEADVSILEMTADNAYAVVTSGGANRLLGSNSDNTALEFKSSLSGLTFVGAFTTYTGVPMVSTITSGNLTQTFDALLPDAADGATLGNATYEWSDLYLADGGVIYGQNDQSATLTSSASTWTANNFGVTTQFKLPSSDADPTATAGYIRHDSSDTDASAGGIISWHDGTNIRNVVDGAANASANYTVIVKTEFIPVAWMTDGAAAPGALTTYETTKYRDFADDATKDLQFIWMTPSDLIGTAIKVRAIAMVTNATAPADEEGVSWGISAAAVAASASVDAARGTVVYSEDTDLDNDCNAQYDVCYFPYVEVTPAVTVAAGTLMAFTVNRTHDDSDDTYGQDIGLIGVEIKYKARINLVDAY